VEVLNNGTHGWEKRRIAIVIQLFEDGLLEKIFGYLNQLHTLS
jgi:hypothetical protein